LKSVGDKSIDLPKACNAYVCSSELHRGLFIV